MAQITIDNPVLLEAVKNIKDELEALENMATQTTSKMTQNQSNTEKMLEVVQFLSDLTEAEIEAVAIELKRKHKPVVYCKRKVQKARENIALLNMNI